MRRWIGRWIAGVGIIHAALGFVMFRKPLLAILHDGVWNAVDSHPGRPLAFWFLFAGLFAILFGSLVDSMEGRDLSLPHFVSWGFLALVILALVTMPVGGGWLLLPAGLGLVVRSYRGRTNAGSAA